MLSVILLGCDSGLCGVGDTDLRDSSYGSGNFECVPVSLPLPRPLAAPPLPRDTSLGGSEICRGGSMNLDFCFKLGVFVLIIDAGKVGGPCRFSSFLVSPGSECVEPSVFDSWVECTKPFKAAIDES